LRLRTQRPRHVSERRALRPLCGVTIGSLSQALEAAISSASFLPWADLLRRVFGIDVLVCPKCAGPRRVLAAIHDPTAIARVLAALGLTAAGVDPAGCRAPPAAQGDAAHDGDAAE